MNDKRENLIRAIVARQHAEKQLVALENEAAQRRREGQRS